ncbi:MAG TPA: hypothetical protein VHA53_00280 [Nitrolancea sp.]|nr:hypothetical protein [Nitrolancea sp.]
MLRFGLLVVFWAIFFLIVLFLEALLLNAAQREPRRSLLNRGTRSVEPEGFFHLWWSDLPPSWRRLILIAYSGLALLYAILLGASVTQALAGELHKFWGVLTGIGVACWIAASLAIIRLDNSDEALPSEESPSVD